MSWPVNDGVKMALGILGNVTALGLFLVPVRTMVTVVQLRSTENFSVFPYIMTLLNCLLWTFYGMPFVGEGRTLVITINALGVALEAAYVLLFFIFNPSKQRVQTSIYTGVVLLFFGAVAAITLAVFDTYDSRSLFVGIVADVASVAMYAAPLEIMWLVIRTKSVKYMPFYLSLLAFANGSAWTAYAVYVRDIYILIPNAVGMILGIAQLILYARYHHIEVVTESKRLMMSKSMTEHTSSMEDGTMQRMVSESGESEGIAERAQSGNGTDDSDMSVSQTRSVAL